VIRELMADDGSVFVHLDQNMVFEIKVIMDEVFGRDRFRNFITRRKCSAKNYTRKTFGNVADHILFYTRSDTYAWQRLYEPWSEKRVREEYPCLDEATGRRYKRVPLHAPGVRRGATGGSWRGMLPPPGKHWQYPPRRLDELDKAGEIYWSKNGNPRRKVFLDASKGVPVNDIWVDFKDPHNQNVHITGYPTEKNFDLLCRIISAASRPGDWVLDCFAGSGTTLEAAEALGRHFIGIDYEKAAIETIQKRLAAGRKPMGDYVKTRRAKNAASAHDLPLFHL
jgi:adenine-specific DNA-methyltransferase